MLTAAVYLPALAHPFVYDDFSAVVGRPLLGLYLLVTPRAATVLSYALDRALGGVQPFAYHATNLGLHLLNVLLLRRLVARWAPGKPSVALSAALLFAVHPLCGEAVRYASARAGILCLAFMLLATLARPRSALAALALLACALLSKESAAMLPIVWLLEDAWLEPDAALRARRLRRFHLPLLTLVGALGIARLTLFARLEGGTTRAYAAHLATQAVVFWRYVRLGLAPVGLTIWHAPLRVTTVATALAAGGLIALAATIFVLRRRAPAAAFGIAWFLLFLAPSSLVPLKEAMAEHRVYEAAPGLLVAVAFALSSIGWSAWTRRCVTAALVLLLGGLALQRGATWSSPDALWSAAVDRAPLAWPPRYALGDARRVAGDCPGAVAAYRAALQLAPGEARIHVNLGICLEQLGDRNGAERAFRTAVALDPESAVARRDLDELLQH